MTEIGLTPPVAVKAAVAVASVPGVPPVNVIVGAEVKPVPAFTIVMPVTNPLVVFTVAVAVAPVPPPPPKATDGAAV